ncbi:hypothetical protein ABN028_20040 [Actinopolymorpha sp. B17G11]|uniref:hypothetical protein n=1 Tax=Actinopolymorpha sp. B17G11 TaxID=3160861 RepID=UPI0032E51BE3
MAPGVLADADAVALALAWLQGNPTLAGEFGGVSGVMEAPWPRLVVTTGPGGDLGDMRWNTRQEVTLEVYGDPDGRPGKAALWRLTMLAASALVELADRGDAPAGVPVVSAVDPNGTLAWSPLANGQHRWIVSCFLTLHPPQAMA